MLQKKETVLLLGKHKYIYLGMIVIYLLSRVYVFHTLVSTQDIFASWQLLDRIWLQNTLFESLYYLHSNPPFFNLLAGMCVKWFPEDYVTVLEWLYLTMGLAVYMMMYRILLFFKVPVWGALLMSTLYIVSPEALLYERWISPVWIDTFLLMSASFTLVMYGEKRHLVYLFLFFGVITLLMITSSTFSLLYLAGLVILIGIMYQKMWKYVVLFSFVPLLAVVTIYTKNENQFGFWGSSSLSGVQMVKKAAYATLEHPLDRVLSMTEKEKQKEVKASWEELRHEGKIESLQYMTGVQTMKVCQSPEEMVPARYGKISALSEPFKHNGECNMNYYHYVQQSKQIREDVFTVWMRYPEGYLRTVVIAMMDYFRPVWDTAAVNTNRERLHGYVKLFDLGELGGTYMGQYGLFFILLMFLSLLFVIGYTIRLLGRKRQKRATVALFMLYTIYFVLISGILLRIDGLNQMRVMTDPLLYILTVAGLTALLRFVFLKRTA